VPVPAVAVAVAAAAASSTLAVVWPTQPAMQSNLLVITKNAKHTHLHSLLLSLLLIWVE
jgi:hypothetical protein